MRKDVVISLLAAGVMVQRFNLNLNQEIGVFAGIAVLSFIFCLFLEDLAEKRKEKKKRVTKLEQTVRKLTGSRIANGRRRRA